MPERLSLDSLVEQVIDERDDTMREVVRLRAEVKRRDEIIGRAVSFLVEFRGYWESATQQGCAPLRQLLADVAALDQPEGATDARG